MIAFDNPFTNLWIFFWGIAFLVIEGTAIFLNRTGRIKYDGTLSSLVWRFIANPKRKALFGVFWAILTAHFFLQWP